jgi:hypothetical protein
MRMIPLALICASALAADRPKLGVVLIVDQLSAQAFEARLSGVKFGFKRLVTEGFVFRECRYEGVPSVTSVGHATLATGAYGESHGITGNEWFDREWNAPRYSSEDKNFSLLKRNGAKTSTRSGTAPTAMMIPTLSEMVRFLSPQAQSVVITGKDRSAILSAGRANLALWLDTDEAIFTTSTFYAKELPGWVTARNEVLLKELGRQQAATRNSDKSKEPRAEQLDAQGLIDTAQIDLAIAAIKNLGLGKHASVDLLTIGFSGHDRIGHDVGPEGKEALENFAHLDVELGRLLTFLDDQLGVNNYVVALSADHGVAPLPATTRAHGGEAQNVDVRAFAEGVEKALDAEFSPKDYIVSSRNPGLTLSDAGRALLPQIYDRIRGAAKKYPGIADAWLGSELDRHGEVGHIYQRGYFEGRSPDIILILKPFYVYGSDGTGHGGAYLYDRAVPLVFFGSGVNRGHSLVTEASNVAPTLSALLHVPTPSGATGKALDVVAGSSSF